MTSIDYETIFSSFLGSITDYDFAQLSMSESFSLMTEYLHTALAESYLRRVFSSVSLDDDAQTLSYELKYVVDEIGDNDFIISLIAKWMVYEWLHKEVRSKNLTSQFFGTKEQKFFSQSNHLTEMRALLDDVYKEARFMLQDRGYINNSYIGGASNGQA